MRLRLMDALGFLSEHHLDRAETLSSRRLFQGVESTRSDQVDPAAGRVLRPGVGTDRGLLFVPDPGFLPALSSLRWSMY